MEISLLGPFLLLKRVKESECVWINIEMWEIYYEEPYQKFSLNVNPTRINKYFASNDT